MEVGSTRLPLKGIVDNTIGQRLQYEAASQRELSPLFAAIQSNASLRLFSVSRMRSQDVIEVSPLTTIRLCPCASALQPRTTAPSDVHVSFLKLPPCPSRACRPLSVP